MPTRPRTRPAQRNERLPDQARALGDPTRYAIFRYLDEAAGPVGVAELTAHFGFNHNAIRQHLAKLREAGLVTEELAAPSGPGRPALRYRPVPGAAERWDGPVAYENLTALLIRLLRGEGTPFEVGRVAGQRLAREHHAGRGAARGTEPDIEHDAVEIVEAIARRLGFEPRREPGRSRVGRRVDVVLDRCPFAPSAAEAPEIVCELHRGLAQGIADEATGSAEVAGLVIRDPVRAGCRIELKL